MLARERAEHLHVTPATHRVDGRIVGLLREREQRGNDREKYSFECPEKDDASTRHLNAELDSINARFAILTPREREVMTHVIAGRLNKQIAGDLGTVEKTIKVHRGRVLEKIGVRSVAELVRLAEKAGISAQGRP